MVDVTWGSGDIEGVIRGWSSGKVGNHRRERKSVRGEMGSVLMNSSMGKKNKE